MWIAWLIKGNTKEYFLKLAEEIAAHVEEKQHEIGSLALLLACCSKWFAAPANM